MSAAKVARVRALFDGIMQAMDGLMLDPNERYSVALSVLVTVNVAMADGQIEATRESWREIARMAGVLAACGTAQEMQDAAARYAAATSLAELPAREV